jgi:hypothetical protein
MNLFQIGFLFSLPVHTYLLGTCKMRNEIEKKRNETKRNETKSSETDRNETKRNQAKRNEMKRNKMKRIFSKTKCNEKK